jgi:hypothetical protein
LEYGVLATKMAAVDFLCGELLRKLVHKEEELLTNYLIKEIHLYKRLDLLKELAHFRTAYKAEILNFVGIPQK